MKKKKEAKKREKGKKKRAYCLGAAVFSKQLACRITHGGGGGLMLFPTKKA